MGTELARHLLSEHELTVWNRTAERAQPLVDEGAARGRSLWITRPKSAKKPRFVDATCE